MKRSKKLLAVAAVLSLGAAAFGIVYYAYPRVLLRGVVAVQRSKAGFALRQVQVDNWSLAYIDSQPQPKGDQETILLIHGFGDNKDRFIELAEDLTDDFRIIALDLPGFGESPSRLDEDYSADFYVRVIVGFLDQLNIDSTHVVGYSMGGLLGTKVASKTPSRVRTLTLLAPAGLLGDQASDVDHLIAEGTNPLVYRDRPSLYRLLKLNFNDDFDIPDFVIRAILAEGIQRADLYALIFRQLFDPAEIPAFEQQIAELKMPTLLIWGDQDRILDVSAMDRWIRINPDIRTVRLSGAGHALIHQRIGGIQNELRSHVATAK